MKKKKIILITVLILILCLGAVGSAIYIIYNKNSKTIKDEISKIEEKYKSSFQTITEPMEYGSSISYEELLPKLIDTSIITPNTKIEIKINNEILHEEEVYNFQTIGNHEIEVTLSTDYKNKNIKVIKRQIISKNKTKIEVTDTQYPTIEGFKNKEIYVGDEINLTDGITATDPIDGTLEVKINSNLNNQKADTYTIKVSATDKNNNTTEKEFTVTVKAKPVVTKPSTSSSSNSNKNNNTTKPSTTTPGTSTTTHPATDPNDPNTKSGRLNLAKAEAKTVIAQIIKPGMTDYEKATAISLYLFNTVDRQTNQSTEAYKTNHGDEAYAALIMKIAACSGVCNAVTLLCNEAGLQSQHINAHLWTHQWNKVLIDGQWLVLDAQIGYFGGDVHPYYGY